MIEVKDTRTHLEEPEAVAGISGSLREAMQALDGSGRMSLNAARLFRHALNSAGGALALRIAQEPEKYFGPFESLSPEAQNAIREAIESEDRWRMLGHEIGTWHIVLARSFARLRQVLAAHGLYRMSDIARLSSLLFKSGPAFLIHSLYKGMLRWRGKAPLQQTLPAMLRRLGVDPRNLAVCYARQVSQPEAYRGFYHDTSRHNAHGVVLGLDLLPADGGFWYIESNLDFGMSRTRAAMYDRDPFVTNLIEFAAENGYRNLTIINKSASYINEEMARQYEEEALARKISFGVVEDAYLPQSCRMHSHRVPPLHGNDTLVVRTKYYRTSLDYLFHHKHASIRALRVYSQNSHDPALLVPGVGPEPVFGDAGPENPFPNLVYKLPERDEGKGVIFLKARSQDHAAELLDDVLRMNRSKGFLDRLYSRVEDRNGLYQQYIRSPLLEGRRLYKVRAHVLITPVGVKFLSAHRVISRYPVPEYLPPGIVQDPRPYLVNLSTSQHYEIVPPGEEQVVMESALAVARGLSWAAAYGFQHADG